MNNATQLCFCPEYSSAESICRLHLLLSALLRLHRLFKGGVCSMVLSTQGNKVILLGNQMKTVRTVKYAWTNSLPLTWHRTGLCRNVSAGKSLNRTSVRKLHVLISNVSSVTCSRLRTHRRQLSKRLIASRSVWNLNVELRISVSFWVKETKGKTNLIAFPFASFSLLILNWTVVGLIEYVCVWLEVAGETWWLDGHSEVLGDWWWSKGIAKLTDKSFPVQEADVGILFGSSRLCWGL